VNTLGSFGSQRMEVMAMGDASDLGEDQRLLKGEFIDKNPFMPAFGDMASYEGEPPKMFPLKGELNCMGARGGGIIPDGE